MHNSASRRWDCLDVIKGVLVSCPWKKRKVYVLDFAGDCNMHGCTSQSEGGWSIWRWKEYLCVILQACECSWQAAEFAAQNWGKGRWRRRENWDLGCKQRTHISGSTDLSPSFRLSPSGRWGSSLPSKVCMRGCPRRLCVCVQESAQAQSMFE